ncbi:MAG: hypothetical protein RLZZ330_911, partial [Actinomycetota bacterium]|jgi:uncharacterized membrane protein
MTKQSILKNLQYGLGFMAFIIGSIGLYLKSACMPTGWGSSNETFTNLCYSDVGPLYFGRGLSENLIPYFEISNATNHVEYPVLTGLQMWLANSLSSLIGQNTFHLFVYITWLMNLLMIVLAVMIFAKLRKVNAESGWWFAFSPAILFVLAINWDALPVLAVVCALFYWQRERSIATGVMIAIGTAAKLFPAFLLPAVILDALRKRDIKAIAKVTFSTVSVWVLINLPVYVNARDGWWHFYDFSKTRGIDFGSIYLAFSFLFNIETPAKLANLIGLASVAMAGLIALAYHRKLNVNEILLLLLGTFLLFNKVYSPQYWLWLTPVVALVLKNRWHWIAWNASQLLYFFGIWRYLLFLQDESAPGAINQQIYSAILLVQWFSLLAVVVYVTKKAIKGSSR